MKSLFSYSEVSVSLCLNPKASEVFAVTKVTKCATRGLTTCGTYGNIKMYIIIHSPCIWKKAWNYIN